MPEIRNYIVTETREVKVVANSCVDAARIAAAAFEHGQMNGNRAVAAGKAPEGVWGNTRDAIRIVGLETREDRY